MSREKVTRIPPIDVDRGIFLSSHLRGIIIEMLPLILTTMILQTPGPQPPIMEPRTIRPAAEIKGGTIHQLQVGDLKADLFIPAGYKPSKTLNLWCHFHSPAWYVIGEYQRLEPTVDPIIVFNFGQGSSVYGKPFTELGSFQPWLDAALNHLDKKPDEIKLNFTSFSAGYGAVRNLIGDPAVLSRLNIVILNDSCYASLDPDQPTRRVLKAHLDVWQPLVNRAIKGDSTFVMSTSQITPESYAGTWEVALQLVEANGGKMQSIERNSHPSAMENLEQRLLRTYHKGRWFVWSYEGTTAEAHMTHARRLAECLREVKK